MYISIDARLPGNICRGLSPSRRLLAMSDNAGDCNKTKLVCGEGCTAIYSQI